MKMMRAFTLRFACCYWLIYLLPFPFGSVPYTEPIALFYLRAREPLIRGVGATLFKLEIPPEQFSGGDTRSHYVWVFCSLVLASLASLAWVLARRRKLEGERARL
ncbi:MAG: hypothetical protein JNK04_17985 [Myxococcales bacterium]|nr:hypothetical protein [Myxococcales bacterium]